MQTQLTLLTQNYITCRVLKLRTLTDAVYGRGKIRFEKQTTIFSMTLNGFARESFGNQSAIQTAFTGLADDRAVGALPDLEIRQ